MTGPATDGPARITVDPAVMDGAPCVRGTRIPVATVLGMLAEGMDPAAVLADYPTLTDADLRAVFGYAAHAVRRPAGSGPAGEPA